MADFPLSLVIGVFAGFFGAIPPGPLNVTCLRKALQGKRREAYRVASGGAVIDALVCLLIGLGLGWILEKVVTNPWVKGVLAVFVTGYGLKLLLVDQRKDREAFAAANGVDAENGEAKPQRPGILGVLTGLLQGAANPALFVNWTILISFLVGHRLFHPSLASALGFALGVGLGVFGWFAVLIELADRWKARAGAWVSRSTIVAGALLVAFGVFFTWRSFATR